jgi:hypothetical protein
MAPLSMPCTFDDSSHSSQQHGNIERVLPEREIVDLSCVIKESARGGLA